jgi:NitT/TauT family transport system substrate-binding protein
MTLTPFPLTATGFNLNYLPEYIALRHGFFKEQGLDVTVTIPVPWDGVLDHLAEGSAKMALGGIWVPSMYRERVQNYTVFAQIANRAPLAILKRGSAEGFKITDLAKSTILMKSGGGASVGLFTKMLLRENNIDARAVDYVQDLDGVMLGNLFQGGMGDYFVTDHLSALAMVAKNPKVSIVVEAVTQGDIPWSVYYQETQKITPELLDAQKRFCIALNKGIDWVMSRDAESYRDELAEILPSVPTDVAVSVTNSFRRNNMWTTTSVNRQGFERWQVGLKDAGLVKEPIAYTNLVNDGPASAASATLIQNGTH